VLALPWPRTRLLPYLAAFAATIAAGTLFLLASSDGWAGFYLLDLPRNHSLDWSLLGGFWTQYLLPHVSIAVVLAAVFFMARVLRREYASVWFYAVAAGGLVTMG